MLSDEDGAAMIGSDAIVRILRLQLYLYYLARAFETAQLQDFSQQQKRTPTTIVRWKVSAKERKIQIPKDLSEVR